MPVAVSLLVDKAGNVSKAAGSRAKGDEGARKGETTSITTTALASASSAADGQGAKKTSGAAFSSAAAAASSASQKAPRSKAPGLDWRSSRKNNTVVHGATYQLLTVIARLGGAASSHTVRDDFASKFNLDVADHSVSKRMSLVRKAGVTAQNAAKKFNLTWGSIQNPDDLTRLWTDESVTQAMIDAGLEAEEARVLLEFQKTYWQVFRGAGEAQSQKRARLEDASPPAPPAPLLNAREVELEKLIKKAVARQVKDLTARISAIEQRILALEQRQNQSSDSEGESNADESEDEAGDGE